MANARRYRAGACVLLQLVTHILYTTFKRARDSILCSYML